MESTQTRIRPATPADVGDLIAMVRELADYERALHSATATPEQFAAVLFPAQGEPTAYAHVGEVRTAEGEWQTVGMALWFLSFSTWTGTNGIWLEDLYVRPEHRRSGLGQGLLRTLAGICVERGYHRLEWWVLDWNEPSIGFYRSIGAESMDEWTRFRLDGSALLNCSALGDVAAQLVEPELR